MKLIFPNPKLSWQQVGDDWFLQLPEYRDNHVGMITGD